MKQNSHIRVHRADEKTMRFAIVQNGLVENVTIAPFDFTLSDEPEKALIVCSPDVGIGDIWDGENFSKPEPPTRTLQIERYQSAIDRHIEAVAISRQYAGSLALTSYFNSGNKQWASEAATFIAWRDSIWTLAYAALDQVQKGEREVPSIPELLAEMPVIEW